MLTNIDLPDINTLSNDDLKQYILTVTAEISRLTGHLERAVERLEDIEDSSFESVEEIVAGDKVKITNNYQGLKGKKAFVTKVTDYYVWLTLRANDKPFKKKKSNVEKV